MKHVKVLSALALAFVLVVFLTAAASAQTAITVSGQLTNGLGEPLPGQQIGIAGPTFGRATTDASGRYAISVAAGSYELSIGQYITETEHYDTSTHIPPYYSLHTLSFDILQNTTLNLQIPFKKLSVHVQDSQGTAAANVFVNVDGGNTYDLAIGSLSTGALLGWGNSYFEGSFNGVVTNMNGDVDYWLLPTSTDPSGCGSWGCGYSVTAQPQAGSQLALTSLDNVALTQDSSVTITLQSGVSLAGQVTDGHGYPLSGLLIMLRGYDPTTGGGLFTDANGRYGFSVSPGWYGLKFDHNRELIIPGDPWSFQLKTDDVTTGSMFEVTQNMRLDLPLPFRRLKVHVVDTNGQPVAGAGVAGDGSFSNVAIGGLAFDGDSLYSYNPEAGQVLRTNANGDASLLLFSSGYGNALTVYPPSETGRPPVSFSITGTGDVNLTLWLDGTMQAHGPTLSSLSPASAEAGGPSFTLAVDGSGFASSSVVRWNGTDRSTTFVSDTRLTAVIPSTDIASPGRANVTVWTPAPGGGESSPTAFTINPPTKVFIPLVAVPPTE